MASSRRADWKGNAFTSAAWWKSRRGEGALQSHHLRRYILQPEIFGEIEKQAPERW